MLYIAYNYTLKIDKDSFKNLCFTPFLSTECPGGPETPCHGNGYCSDGLQGNGQCVCTGHFTGLECNKCIHGWAGSDCNIGNLLRSHGSVLFFLCTIVEHVICCCGSINKACNFYAYQMRTII